MRNILEKVPEEDKATIKPYLTGIRDAADYATGLQLAECFITQFKEKYPTATRSFEEQCQRAKTIPAFSTKKVVLNLLLLDFGEQAYAGEGLDFQNTKSSN